MAYHNDLYLQASLHQQEREVSRHLLQVAARHGTGTQRAGGLQQLKL